MLQTLREIADASLATLANSAIVAKKSIMGTQHAAVSINEHVTCYK